MMPNYEKQKKIAIIIGVSIGALVVIVLAIYFVQIFASGNKRNTDNNSMSYSQPESLVLQTDKPTEKQTELSIEEFTENDYQKSCIDLDYKTLARDPNNYKGKNITISGQVDYVDEESANEPFEIALNVTKDSISYKDIVYIMGKYNPEIGHITEGDIIRIWGKGNGLYKRPGDSNEYPCIKIEYYSFIEPVPNPLDIKSTKSVDINDEKEFKETCTEIDAINLVRFPNRVKDKNIKITGEVYYVKETDQKDIYEVQILTQKDAYGYDLGYSALLSVKMNSNNRILEDDVLTVWGVGKGLKYKTIYSAEPLIDVKYYTIEK